MKTVNSLSGGKTSSYMAVHYPADYNVFALVTIDDIRCKPKDDGLVKYVSDKIGKEFIATAERDATLYAMRDLEQIIGREIVWVTGLSFDRIISKNNFLPSRLRRYCTSDMKLLPISQWWYDAIGEKVEMRIGFRYDEMERAQNLKTDIKVVVGKQSNGNRKWKEFNWRDNRFPLIEDRIVHTEVIKWSQKSGIVFPADSNCVGCFHKPLQQLRKNWEEEQLKMQWFSDAEKKPAKRKGRYVNQRFKQEEITYEQIKKMGLQMDFNFGTGSGCDAGYCTD